MYTVMTNGFFVTEFLFKNNKVRLSTQDTPTQIFLETLYSFKKKLSY